MVSPTEPSRSAASPNSEEIVARDRIWLERVRTGDVEAFEAIFRAYKNDLGAFVTSYLRSRAAAEEVIQELFLRLWEHRDEWEITVPLAIYLFRAARNGAISYLRHERVEARFRERVANGESEGFEPRQLPGADESADASDLEDAIMRAVDALPERCREVFRLNRYHHLSYAQVALVMQISVKTVEVQMGRALTALRVRLAAWRE